MKKPWSISTTVRNPERIISFLKVLANFEGEPFDEEKQVEYQIRLIQARLYQPNGLSNEFLNYYKNPQDMTIDQAKRIFQHMKDRSKVLKDDPGLRGRTSAAPLEKMGLAMIKRTNGDIKITDIGRKFINEKLDIGEVFLQYFYKWSLYNPDSGEFTENDGFNIRPFISTLRIIEEVNKRWESLGEKPVGLSKEEFYIFVPTTINYEDIPNTVNEIIDLRNSRKGKNKTEKRDIFKKFAKDKIIEFFGDAGEEDWELNLRNLKDYGDNIIRYFKLTRFFNIRGNGFYFDAEPRRKIEISSLLEESDGRRLELNDMSTYLQFINKEVTYPWETLEKLKRIAISLINDTIKIDKSLKTPEGIENELKKINIQKMNKGQLKTTIRAIRDKRKEIQEQKNHLELVSPDKLKEIITNLKNIYNYDDRPVKLEYLITLCLHGINDALKIQPNYPVGDDNKPTFTAPANVPDIECFYKSFNIICEVTMLTSRDQWFSEGQPVMRHLRDFEKNKNGKSFCLFIAPKIHRDTFNTFNLANKYEYEGAKQRIIPLTINQFLIIMNRVLLKKEEKKPITQEEFKNILERLYLVITSIKDINNWLVSVNEILNEYAKSGELV
jgi:hypothetical protein